MRVRCGVLFIVALLLTSCAQPNHFEPAVLSWQDHDVQSLMGAWGYPLNIKTLKNGSQVYTYKVVPEDKKIKTQKLTEKQKKAKQAAARALALEHKLTPLPEKRQGVIRMAKPEGWQAPDLPPANGKPRQCIVKYVVNENNQIIAVHYHGNYCVATKSFVLEMANPQGYHPAGG